jgi:hypothetical protein
MGLPRAAARLGSWNTRFQYTLPRLEKHKIVSRMSDEQLDEVFVFHRGGALAATGTALHLVFGDRLALGVAGSETSPPVLRLDEILGGQIEMIAVDLCGGAQRTARAPR